MGSAFKTYVPNNAYLVLVSRAAALKIAEMQSVQWVGRRPSRHKVSLSLAEEAAVPYISEKIRSLRSVAMERDKKQGRVQLDEEDESKGAGDAAAWTSALDQDDVSEGESVRAQEIENVIKDRYKTGSPQSRSKFSQEALQDDMEEWQRKSVVSLHVTVPTADNWNNAMQVGQGYARAIERSADSFAHRSFEEMSALGVNVLDTFRVSDEKVVVRVKPNALRDALEWLGDQPEVLWVEKGRRYYPFMSGATRLLIDGPSIESETSEATSISRRGIDGAGQIIGAADSGLDWDSCFFWQSSKSRIYKKRGVPPPFQLVDRERRKLISYNWHQDCKVCDRCPLDVEGDSITFVSANGLLEAEKDKRLKFPEDNDDKKSSIPPRNYDSSGATLKFSVQAVTRNVPSEYLAQGGGAFEIKVEIQVFIVPRAETENFDTNNPDHYAKCLNQCDRAKGNLVEEELVVLDAANGGYGIIIANRGLERDDGLATIHANILLKGKMQFKTALKPCGDNGDDRTGHGTHAVASAVGAADTPELAHFSEQKAFAAKFNGIAPGAKLYFEDVQQNANSDCNVPGKICPRVNELTIPVDLGNDLFLKPYNEGVRVHLNSWGCKVNDGERPGLCNKYTARSRDVDKFVYEHPDFLPIFAAGEMGLLDAEGSVAEPGTCKNCLTVGSSNTFQKRYREAVMTRDPQTDVCGACQHPYFCSRSEIIGDTVMDTPAKLQEALDGLPKCCNDTLHEHYHVEEIEVPSYQWFTVHLPDTAWENGELERYIRDKYNWIVDGASLIYDFKAKFATISDPSATSDEAKIQVVILLRQDFYQYFEAGTMSCNEPDPPEFCRNNPCVTSSDKQNDGTERCMSVDGSSYQPVSNCETLEDDPLWKGYDNLCHKGECSRMRRLEDTQGVRVKDESAAGEWGKSAQDRCPLDLDLNPIETCCNDRFLYDMCINKNEVYSCKEVGNRLQRIVREPGRVDMLKKGFGVAVRNMNDAAIKLTGTVEIRQQQYPCTLRDCCGDDENPQTACCAKEYPRVFAAGEACDQCGPVPSPGICHPSEVNNLPSWTSRGPAQSNFINNIGGRQFKPELVAPGTQIVSANSDGAVPNDDEFAVQCDLPSRTIFTDQYKCMPSTADEYFNTTSVRAQTGSSVAAAQVAGSAALIRQYLIEGYYPTGLKNTSNLKFAQPQASLVKAMLLNSARSVGGNSDTYTYNYPPPCDPTIEICSPWFKPKPQDCTTDATFEDVDCYVRRDQLSGTPSNIEGYGRPVLSKVMWTNDSEYSLYIDESFIPQGYQRTYTFPILELSPSKPTKITLVWTDEPGVPEADNVLVNDLDLIVQLASSQVLYNPNQGIKTVVDIFEPYYGNAGGKAKVSDRANVIEEVTLDAVNGDTNLTVLVIGARVPRWATSTEGGQKYSLVVTGQMMPKYQAWNATRQSVLDFVNKNSRGSMLVE